MIRKSYCPICSGACGLLVEVDDASGDVLSVRGDPDHLQRC